MVRVSLHALEMYLKGAKTTPAGTAVVLKKYPEMARDLPEVIWNGAYSAEPPVHINLPVFDEVLERCPRRKSHVAVKGSRDGRSSPLAASAASAASMASSSGLTESGIQTMIASFANRCVADQPVVKMEASPSPDGSPCRSYQIVATDQRFPSRSLSDLDDVVAASPHP